MTCASSAKLLLIGIGANADGRKQPYELPEDFNIFHKFSMFGETHLCVRFTVENERILAL